VIWSLQGDKELRDSNNGWWIGGGMRSFLNDFGKYWLERQGRKRSALRYPFRDDEIVSQAYLMRVSSWFNAYYLNLHPSHYAIAITPAGRLINVRGGYNALLPGRYILHYVDRQNRVFVIPRVTETTLDGAQVSLELVITYQVVDPFLALEVQQPLETFFVFIQSDLREFIRTHKYDEIVGDTVGHAVNTNLVAQYIRDQHRTREQMSKLFKILEVVVEEKTGDPKLTEIRGKFEAKQRQNVADSELLRQNQDLERRVASQDAEIQRIKAKADATEQEIRQKMDLQSIELEKARAELDFRQKKMMRAMDAIAQAFAAPTYPRDPREVEIIKELLGALGGTQNGSGNGQDQSKPQSTDRIDTLTNTLLNWLDRKRT
jgi:regulator of protease activity HflC (stomatin/prohibitin superfamily)